MHVVPQFFFHVPKTGGSTIKTCLIERFGQDNVANPQKTKAYLADLWLGRKCGEVPEGLPCIYGHWASLSIIRGQEGRYHKVCFWRHPADYVLSYYNWSLFRERNRKLIKRSYCIGNMEGSLPCNPMTQDFLLYCGDVPGWRYFLMSDRQKFDAAIRLACNFDLFADVSEVDTYLKSSNLVSGDVVEWRNSVATKDTEIMDDVSRHRLERLNPVDYYVHRYSVSTDKAAVIAEAQSVLSPQFSWRDLGRALTRPYHRFMIKVVARV